MPDFDETAFKKMLSQTTASITAETERQMGAQMVLNATCCMTALGGLPLENRNELAAFPEHREKICGFAATLLMGLPAFTDAALAAHPGMTGPQILDLIIEALAVVLNADASAVQAAMRAA